MVSHRIEMVVALWNLSGLKDGVVGKHGTDV